MGHKPKEYRQAVEAGKARNEIIQSGLLAGTHLFTPLLLPSETDFRHLIPRRMREYICIILNN
jgi:hypothetical protein